MNKAAAIILSMIASIMHENNGQIELTVLIPPAEFVAG